MLGGEGVRNKTRECQLARNAVTKLLPTVAGALYGVAQLAQGLMQTAPGDPPGPRGLQLLLTRLNWQ
jgi:hypothetical protein